MFIAIGYVVVLLSVFGGYVLSGGSLGPLWQPTELLIIGGAGLGAFIAANNRKALFGTLKAASRLKRSTKYNKETYIDLMVLLYALLSKSKRDGMKAIEGEIDDPQSSEIFKQHPKVLNDPLLLTFIRDYMRMMVGGGSISPHELDELMLHEIEELEHDLSIPADAFNKVADAMPAFGIVAAVMGVVKALTVADATPQQMGEMIAHALVGTFLGILLAYGFFNPLATKIERQVAESIKALHCIRQTIVASLHGYQPQVAVEFGRKALHADERPESLELEEIIRESKRANKP